MSYEISRVNIDGVFLSLLTVLFIGLKLTHYIDWSWWWVLSPLWIPLVVFVLLIILIIIATVLMSSKITKNLQTKNKVFQKYKALNINLDPMNSIDIMLLKNSITM